MLTLRIYSAMHISVEEDTEKEKPFVENLLAKCHTLLNELEEFRTFLAERNKEHTVELRQFRSSVLSELKSLEKVLAYRLPFYTKCCS